jgi:hypothetical protein
MGEAREVMDRLTEVAFFEAFPDASYVRNTPSMAVAPDFLEQLGLAPGGEA